MNYEKTIFGFFSILTLALNLGFVVGQADDARHHSDWMLFAAVMVGLIATGLKLGDRSHLGALVLAAGLVANLLLMIAISVWAVSEGGMGEVTDPGTMVSIVSLAYGALAANAISVALLVSDTLMSRR